MAWLITGIKPRVEFMLGYWGDDVHRLWVILVVVFAGWVGVLQFRRIRGIIEFLKLFANLWLERERQVLTNNNTW